MQLLLFELCKNHFLRLPFCEEKLAPPLLYAFLKEICQEYYGIMQTNRIYNLFIDLSFLRYRISFSLVTTDTNTLVTTLLFNSLRYLNFSFMRKGSENGIILSFTSRFSMLCFEQLFLCVQKMEIKSLMDISNLIDLICHCSIQTIEV